MDLVCNVIQSSVFWNTFSCPVSAASATSLIKPSNESNASSNALLELKGLSYILNKQIVIRSSF